MSMFRKVEVSEVIEQATAAPGEKRTASFHCDECGF
jgi:hypothetical protein